MKFSIRLFALLALCTAALFGQATTLTTQTTAAIAPGDTQIYTSIATRIFAPSTNASVGTVLAVGREMMAVRAVNGKVVTVRRGYGNTKAGAYPSGATVYIGAPNYFGSSDPTAGGACTAANLVALPLVVPFTGNVWTCAGSLWVRVSDGGPFVDDGFTVSTTRNVSVGNRVITAAAVTAPDITTPSNPAAGSTMSYYKGGKLCSLSPAGVEACTGASGFSSTVALGDPTVNGSWQLVVSGANLLIQKRESGAWVTKTTVVP